MRYLWGLALALVLACGSDSSGPGEGTVAFVLDGQTCGGGPYAIELFINGASRGTFTASPGQQVGAFEVTAGTMNVSARLVNSTITWGPATIQVNAGSTFTYTMTC